MTRKYRLTLIALALAVLLVVGRLVSSDFAFILGEFWFTSGLLLLVLLSLIDQPHFSKDSNIFVNAVTAAVSLLLVPSESRDLVYWAFFSLTVYLLVSSYALLWLRDRSLAEENPTIRLCSRLNREIGKPDALFSAFFLWGAIKQFGENSGAFHALLGYWVVFTILNVPSLARTIEDFFSSEAAGTTPKAIGQIFGVQSKNIFLVKLFPFGKRAQPSRVFDFVELHHGARSHARRGLIIDNYILNQEQWVKVLSSPQVDSVFRDEPAVAGSSTDIVYRIDSVPTNDLLRRLVGIVTDRTRIGYLRFVYNSAIHVAEGQLLGVEIDGREVLYQIVEGVTLVENLERKNESGMIVGEAVQLGTWNREKFQFDQFGWVPEINTPVFLATDIREPAIGAEEIVVGHIPNTNYPVVLNKALAISHHMAVIGVTGTGKSIFSRNLIRRYLEDRDTKVICVDFTAEYAGKFADLAPCQMIEDTVAEQLFKDIDSIERLVGNNYNRDNDESRALKKKISTEFATQVKSFLEGDSKLAIFELPSVENTSGVLTYTKAFFRVLFHIAKTEGNFGQRVCLVLEEAHTIVPEWNFSGVSDKISQPLLNSIAQIALQGRKYNVGLLVIAQRTANVSKTILTQCNTIVAFQEFDKTSSDFLANYFGQDIVQSLPKLRFRQAIAAGKAFRSSVPMIFEVPQIEEPTNIESESSGATTASG